MKKLNIGLFGFGTVGRGLFDVIGRIGSDEVSIRRICVRNKRKDRGVRACFTDNPDDIFSDPEINVIVELIDEADASFEYVCRALRQGLPVVSGNKKMIAAHLPELIALQEETGAALLYDASACGSIPVIRNLEEYYDNDLLTSVKGILNGSTNYILWRMFQDGISYAEALRQAQELGFAESNPSLDVDGWDSLFKLIIITVHAFGIYVRPEDVFRFGISSLNDQDVRFAREKGRRIKLVGHVEKLPDNSLIMSVMPQLLSPNKYIYSVDEEFNGVVIKGLFYGKQFMFGRGAGGYPTGSSVLSDISALKYDYHYQYKKIHAAEHPEYTLDTKFRIYYRYSRPEHLAILPFSEILEQYTSTTDNYVVGLVSLADLHAHQKELEEAGVFIAAYPRD